MTEVAALGSSMGELSQKLCESHVCWLSVPLTAFLCWLPVSAGCLSPLADCFWLSASGCLYLAVCIWLFASGCLPLTVCIWLSASGCLHLAVCLWLSASGCLHPAVCLWLSAVQWTVVARELRVSPACNSFQCQCLQLLIVVASHSMLSSVLPVPRQRTESIKTVTTIIIIISIHYITQINKIEN